MRILFLIPAMGSAGGAQRMMAHLAWQFAPRHELTLMTWETTQSNPFFPLPTSIRIVQAELLGGRGWFDRFLRILRRFAAIRRQVRLSRPDVILSFMDTMNIAAIVGCLGTGIPLVVSERIDPSRHRIGASKSIFRRLLYPLADCCVVQTQRVKNYFRPPFRPRVAVIPNPVTIPSRQARPESPNREGRFRIIALGRLDRQKGFDVLIEAFAELAAAYPEWDLVIFGEGPARPTLTAQVTERRLNGRIRLAGVTADPAAELAESHIIGFPSRFEGFPNALAEGLAAGLPAVGHTEVSGVEELIIREATGLLVDPADGAAGLAEALGRLMDDPALRRKLGAEGRRRMARWSMEAVCTEWESCLVVATKGRA